MSSFPLGVASCTCRMLFAGPTSFAQLRHNISDQSTVREHSLHPEFNKCQIMQRADFPQHSLMQVTVMEIVPKGLVSSGGVQEIGSTTIDLEENCHMCPIHAAFGGVCSNTYLCSCVRAFESLCLAGLCATKRLLPMYTRGNIMRAECLSYIVCSEGPEYLEYVMHIFYLKYSSSPKMRKRKAIPPSWSCSANNRKLRKIIGAYTIREYVMHTLCIEYSQE